MNVLILTYTRSFDPFYPGNYASEKVKAMFPQCNFRIIPRGEHGIEDLEWAEIIAGVPLIEELRHCKNMKWLHVWQAGVEGYGVRGAYPNPDVLVTRTKGVFDVPMAEHAVGFIIALSRFFPLYIRRQAEHIWKWDNRERVELLGSTALILGAGSIGTEIAKRLKAMGMTVNGYKRTPAPSLPGFDAVYSGEELYQALGEADYVLSVLPGSQGTRRLMDERAFRAMKPTAYFTNQGRGTVVDTDALVKALQEGWIAGAGLDVTDPEPLPEDHPLFDMDNVLITPHTSGFSAMANERRINIFTDLLSRYLKGKELYNFVDMDKGY